MNRTQKVDLVASMHRTFADTALVVVTRQTGLTVAEADTLRRQMREAGARYRVTKNRLARIAVKGTPYEPLAPAFTGPTAIATSDDPVAAAKVAVEYANRNAKLTVIAGALGEAMLDAEQVKALARLPSLDELRASLIALIQAPATKLAGVIQAPAGQLARVMQARSSQEASDEAGSDQNG